MPSQQQTLEQRRAASAWQKIQEVNGQPDAFKKKYSGLARKAPALIMTAGLGQALAFWRAKAGGKADEHQMLYNHLSTWVMGEMKMSGSDDLLGGILRQSSTVYRQATAEALAFLVWLKRFAEAELPEPEGE